jgi:hypothetical protein
MAEGGELRATQAFLGAYAATDILMRSKAKHDGHNPRIQHRSSARLVVFFFRAFVSRSAVFKPTVTSPYGYS